jgi:type II secretory pathway component PulL
VIARVQRLAARAWLGVATGCGFAFVARDLLELPGGAIALVWVAAALAGFFGLGGR